MAECKKEYKEAIYVLTLTEEEAQWLRNLTGWCGAHHKPSRAIYLALKDVGLTSTRGWAEVRNASGLD